MSPTPLRQKQRRKQQRQLATKGGARNGNTGGNGNIASSLQYQAQWYRLRLAWLRKINCTRGKSTDFDVKILSRGTKHIILGCGPLIIF